MNRKINFGAGPAAFPKQVLAQASEAMIDYQHSGMSIIEIPHRGKLFNEIIEESKALVNELCALENEYEILWLQGGRLQFAMIPMNFLNENEFAGYIDSGNWAYEAAHYATTYGNVKIMASSREHNYTALPNFPDTNLDSLAYLHLTTNNTIYGTQWKTIPDVEVPLIADMSSDIYSMPRDYKKYAMFYAVAQKNLGAAGVTLVAIHKDFLKKKKNKQAPILDYSQHVAKNAVLNTPPVFSIYTSLLMLRWIKEKTLTTVFEENKAKANLIYTEIDRNSLFTGTVTNPSHRSLMNACFVAQDEGIETQFLNLCSENNIVGIKGHRSAGGFRVSLYNAIQWEDVEKLVSLMQEFENQKSKI